MSWSPGLITHVGNDWMEVRVPTGDDCTVCPAKSACSFEGPKKAYRDFRVARGAGLVPGDRVEVEEPASVLAVAFVAFVAAPAILLAFGFGLAARIDNLAHWPILTSTAGVAAWLLIIVLAERWVSRSRRFQARIRTRDRHTGV